MLGLTPSQIVNYEREGTALQAEMGKVFLVSLRAAIASSFSKSSAANEVMDALEEVISGQRQPEEEK